MNDFVGHTDQWNSKHDSGQSMKQARALFCMSDTNHCKFGHYKLGHCKLGHCNIGHYFVHTFLHYNSNIPTLSILVAKSEQIFDYLRRWVK